MRASLLHLLALARALELPLFPLRKAPRCPTDRLSLNLFEPRYVALAERVLASDGVFAGLHCEGPHVLPRGRGPATPLVAEGGVGSVFAVDDWECASRPGPSAASPSAASSRRPRTARTSRTSSSTRRP